MGQTLRLFSLHPDNRFNVFRYSLACSRLFWPKRTFAMLRKIFPYFWLPFLLTAVVLVAVGLLMNGGQDTADMAPWFLFPALSCALLGILIWVVTHSKRFSRVKKISNNHYAASFSEAAISGKPTNFATRTLDNAEAVLEQTVTIGSTAYSAHPVKVFVEREGVILSLRGTVEQETQKREVEAAVRQIPGVVDVINFLTVENELQGNPG